MKGLIFTYALTYGGVLAALTAVLVRPGLTEYLRDGHTYWSWRFRRCLPGAMRPPRLRDGSFANHPFPWKNELAYALGLRDGRK